MRERQNPLNANIRNQITSKIGVKAAQMLYVGSFGVTNTFTYHSSTREWSGSRSGSHNHEVDLVYEKGSTYIVVEAKAGDSPLRTRQLLQPGANQGKRARQGTKEYLEDVMWAMATNGVTDRIQEVGQLLLDAKVNGKKIVYNYVHIPIGSGDILKKIVAGDFGVTL